MSNRRITFDTAFERLLGHEGNFQNKRSDRGNWTSGKVGVGELRGTKFGISAMSYPNENIRELTVDRAKFLYRRDFWARVGGDELHAAIVFQLFDAAVNHGPGNAIRILQRAVDVADDGDFGPITEGATKALDVNDVLMKFNAERIRFFARLSTFNDYGRGWMRRVADNLDYAADDYTAPWYENLEVTA